MRKRKALICGRRVGFTECLIARRHAHAEPWACHPPLQVDAVGMAPERVFRVNARADITNHHTIPQRGDRLAPTVRPAPRSAGTCKPSDTRGNAPKKSRKFLRILGAPRPSSSGSKWADTVRRQQCGGPSLAAVVCLDLHCYGSQITCDLIMLMSNVT
jgi:hypothetical protein